MDNQQDMPVQEVSNFNQHGYLLDARKEPICPSCHQTTNAPALPPQRSGGRQEQVVESGEQNMRKLKLWWKHLRCPHTRRAKFYPSDVTWWNTLPGGGSGTHKTVVVEGCLNCHRMWMRDYGE